MLITDVKARWVLDSRARPTVYAEVVAGKFKGWAIAPSGASTGKNEALELRDSGKAFGGFGVNKAVSNINGEIKNALIGVDVLSQENVDATMLELDGTSNKRRLGGNAIIAVSMAAAKCAAKVKGQQLYEHISEISHSTPSIPTPMFNVINGGAHAGNDIAVQEFLLVPSLKKIEENIKAAQEIYLELRSMLLKKFGKAAVNVGDEGGFAPPMKRVIEVVELLERAIENSGYENKVKISLDAAANSFFAGKEYNIDGRVIGEEELLEYYVNLCKNHNILSIEDPFEESAEEAFRELKDKGVCKVIGDDLTVTNVNILRRVSGTIDGLIIKPNQIGTVSETLECIKAARELAPMMIGSHRSGDSEDTFIADFSVGASLPYVKFGAPARGERTCKYNKLMHIGDEIEG